MPWSASRSAAIPVTLPGSVAYPPATDASIAPNTSVACVVDLLFTQAYS